MGDDKLGDAVAAGKISAHDAAAVRAFSQGLGGAADRPVRAAMKPRHPAGASRGARSGGMMTWRAPAAVASAGA